ncbi:hypothetical protein C0583_06960 [Candidatus Parcubacteria bacterium]|nr:MAG: hypothetical protein C0583_06960 [Candidatus Parcubacteria bacterium]
MIIKIGKGKKIANLRKKLLKSDCLSKDQMQIVFKNSRKNRGFLSDLILSEVSIDKEDRALEMLSEYHDLPVILLRNKKIPFQTLSTIPKEIASNLKVVVFQKTKHSLYVATTCPENKAIFDFFSKRTDLRIKLFITTNKDIEEGIKRYALYSRMSLPEYEEANSEKTQNELKDVIPVRKKLNDILEKSIAAEASDIHIEPNHDKITVRFRIDGILQKTQELPKSLLPAVAARVKLMANLKIDEHMVPQDGRFHFQYNDRQVAFRVSIIPTLNGPKIAMRVLEMNKKSFSLQKLGFNKIHLQTVKDNLNLADGMILATGPTGSGKTTSLYTLLQMINKDGINISTIEDPIEYGIDNVNQMQIREDFGLSFAEGLRSLLRQDPDVIMVGEIRDDKTAKIAAGSAMTGHLVLSTLHTNNALLASQRLIEMGLQPYLVSSVLRMVVGQRLVRKACPKCSIKSRSNDKVLESFENDLNINKTIEKLYRLGLIQSKDIESFDIVKTKGCRHCHKSGYQGRMGIYEVFELDDEVRRLVAKDVNESTLREHMEAKNYVTMSEDGILKALTGQTTFEEVLRVTKAH